MSRPVITVPLVSKWYHLLLTREGITCPLPFEDIEVTVGRNWNWADDGSVVGDHIVHPKAVRMYASLKGFHVDDLSYELLVGRWVLEWPGCDAVAAEMGEEVDT